MTRQTSRPVQAGQMAGARPRITGILNEALREHVTIVNGGTMAQPMAGWALASLRGERVYAFPTGLILLPGMEVAVHSGQEAPDHPPCDLLWTQEQVWNNRADTAVLFDAHGVEVDRVPYPPRQTRAARSRKALIRDGDTWRIVDEPVHPSERPTTRR